jgi:hypothetical protein
LQTLADDAFSLFFVVVPVEFLQCVLLFRTCASPCTIFKRPRTMFPLISLLFLGNRESISSTCAGVGPSPRLV